MALPTKGWAEIADGAWGTGAPDAPTLAVVGGTHGDERVGAQIVEDLRQALDPHPLSWQLRILIGNPRALAAGVRHIDSDLNRAFGEAPIATGYEAARAETLRGALGRPAVLLDIHQTHCDTPPLAVVRDTPAHLALARALGLETAVVDADRIYGSTMLADWVDAAGGLGLTIESGRADSDEAKEAALRVVRRAIRRDWDPGAQIQVYAVRSVLRAPWPGLRFHRDLGNGSPVRAGEVLATRDGETLCAPDDGVLLLPHEDVAQGDPAAVFAFDRGQVTVDHAAWREVIG
ncbi:MAG: succinylglutamate desuccinylase/aspartoacylase family protein [Myxococcota bacterium]|nr:succinylglutamate desuccinylase/aspartoacylase family protein [Myxococcota bacterium]